MLPLLGLSVVSPWLVQVFQRGYGRRRDLDLICCKSSDLRFNLSLAEFGKVSHRLGLCNDRHKSPAHASLRGEGLAPAREFLPKDRTAISRMFDQSLVFSVVRNKNYSQ